MVLSLWQNLALIILAFMVPVDKYGFTFGLRWPVITAMIAGAIVGDMNTALIIGGTLQLMSLGVASIGGSSVPEYGVGADVVNAVLAAMPQWFTGGLSIASKMLPVVGVALLLNYMPAKKYLPAILLGYFLVAFMNISMLGVAIVSAIIAMVFYAYKNESSNTVVNGGLEDE